jgi:hypothetical protein
MIVEIGDIITLRNFKSVGRAEVKDIRFDNVLLEFIDSVGKWWSSTSEIEIDIQSTREKKLKSIGF